MSRQPIKRRQPRRDNVVIAGDAPAPVEVRRPAPNGLPFDQVLAFARKCFAEGARAGRNAEMPAVEPSEKWPYPTAYRLGFGVFRSRATYGLPEAEALYGLAVRVQSPRVLPRAAMRRLEAEWYRRTGEFGVPVSVRRISPVFAALTPHIGAAAGTRPHGDPLSSSVTAFVKRAGQPAILGLTVAHGVDQVGRPAEIGEPVYCPFPAMFEADQPCGELADIRRLTIDPMAEDVDLEETPLAESLDAAIFTVKKDILQPVNRASLNRVEHRGRQRRLAAPVPASSLYAHSRSGAHPPRAHKLSSRSPAVELRMTSAHTAIEIIMPDGQARAADGLMEFEATGLSRIGHGDSGTLIVADRRFHALGMLVAGVHRARLIEEQSRAYYAVPLDNVFKTLGLVLA